MKKIFNHKILSIILGSICLIGALVFAPIWDFWDSCPWKDWGMGIVNLLIAACIVCYLIFYLSKKIKKPAKKVIKVLTVIEFAIFCLIALGCVFSQFDIINIKGACKIFGFALWTRGTIELFRAYYYRADSKEVYPVWYLALSIALVTLGVYAIAKPFIADVAILWIFVGTLVCAGALLIVVPLMNKKSK